MEELGRKIGWVALKGFLKKAWSAVRGGVEVEAEEQGRRVSARAPSVEELGEVLEKAREFFKGERAPVVFPDDGVGRFLAMPIPTPSGLPEVEEAKRLMKSGDSEKAEEKMRELLSQPAPAVEAPSEEQAFLAALRLLDEGDRKFHADDFAGSENAYREAYEMSIESGNELLQSLCLNLLGAAIASQDRHEEALALLDEALRLTPDSVEAWYNKGLVLAKLKLRRYHEAIPCYDEAIRLKPDFVAAWYAKGMTLAVLERYEEAIPCFGEAIRLNPDDGEAWKAKGAALAQLQRAEKAIYCFDEAIRIGPDDAEAWHLKGVVLDRLGRYEEALSCFDEATRIRPEDAKAWCDKGAALSDLERYEEAIPCLDEALKLNHNDGRAWAVRGRALLELDQDKEAKHSFEKALPLRDQHPDKGMLVFSALALLILLDGMESVASKDMKEAEERVSELTQLRKEAQKDYMAQVVDDAIAKFKQGLPKKLLKDFRKFEKMLEEVKEP